MKKKLIKFLILPLLICVSLLFILPTSLFANDALAPPIEFEPGTPESTIGSGGTIGVFNDFLLDSISPRTGINFTVMSTGCCWCNDVGNTWNSGGSTPDYMNFDVGPITVPAGMHSFTFDYYYISAEPGSGEQQHDDTFWAELDGATFVSVDSYDADNYLGTVAGSALYDTGWKTAGASVSPGDTISIGFYITDYVNGKFDSAVILDNFKWKTKSGVGAAEEPAWIRGDQQMECSQVWINEDGMFQFSFIYPYADNNWVRIYDMEGNMVYEIDMPYDNPNIIVDLPDGTYTVKTFHDQPEPLQTFIIGKP